MNIGTNKSSIKLQKYELFSLTKSCILAHMKENCIYICYFQNLIRCSTVKTELEFLISGLS